MSQVNTYIGGLARAVTGDASYQPFGHQTLTPVNPSGPVTIIQAGPSCRTATIFKNITPNKRTLVQPGSEVEEDELSRIVPGMTLTKFIPLVSLRRYSVEVTIVRQVGTQDYTLHVGFGHFPSLKKVCLIWAGRSSCVSRLRQARSNPLSTYLMSSSSKMRLLAPMATMSSLPCLVTIDRPRLSHTACQQLAELAATHFEDPQLFSPKHLIGDMLMYLPDPYGMPGSGSRLCADCVRASLQEQRYCSMLIDRGHVRASPISLPSSYLSLKRSINNFELDSSGRLRFHQVRFTYTSRGHRYCPFDHESILWIAECFARWKVN
jgi:hypothetical protein